MSQTLEDLDAALQEALAPYLEKMQSLISKAESIKPAPYTTIIHRRGTTENLQAVNPLLPAGEVCFEFASISPDGQACRMREDGEGKAMALYKIGDGVNRWNDLPYASGPPGPKGDAGTVSATISSEVDLDKDNILASASAVKKTYDLATLASNAAKSAQDTADDATDWLTTAQRDIDVLQALIPMPGGQKDAGKALMVEDAGFAYVLKSVEVIGRPVQAGEIVWMSGTKLDHNCVWPDRSLVLLSEWPDLKTRYESGYITTVAEVEGATHPGLFVRKPDGSGLYLPDFGGLFPRMWRMGEQARDNDRRAGEFQEDAMQKITGAFNAGLVNSHVGGSGAFYSGASAAPMALTNTSQAAYAYFDSSRIVRTADATRPQNYAQPISIYLGRHASEIKQ